MAGPVWQTDNGVVTVTTLWADERLCYPVNAMPYTPARHFPKGKNDPAFRTKLQIGAGLAIESGASTLRGARLTQGLLPVAARI